MKAWMWLRMASGFTAFFAAGHTYGHFHFANLGPQAEGVRTVMKAVHFDIMGSRRTVWDFHEGYSLFVMVTPVVLAVLMWLVSNLARSMPKEARPLVLTLLAGQIAFAILGWTHFFLAPAVINSLAAVCLLVAALAL